MTRRTLAIIAIAMVVLVGSLFLGLRWLTSGGVALPTSPAGAELATPGATSLAIGLPRRNLTPGAIHPAATQDSLDETVCKAGWAASIRPPSGYTSALKVAQILEYGYADKDPRDYQEDHLVPLELGGAPRDKRNLWPEPNTITLADGTSIGSKEKDDLEDYLHDQVCSGSMLLAEAQLSIARDWIAAWERAGRP